MKLNLSHCFLNFTVSLIGLTTFCSQLKAQNMVLNSNQTPKIIAQMSELQCEIWELGAVIGQDYSNIPKECIPYIDVPQQEKPNPPQQHRQTVDPSEFEFDYGNQGIEYLRDLHRRDNPCFYMSASCR